MRLVPPALGILFKGVFWILVLATLWLSLVPVDQLPSEFLFWDKAQHAIGFSALAYSGLLGYPGRVRLLMIGLMLFGAAIEYTQSLTGWRQGDLIDWMADCVGLVIGNLAWRVAHLLPKIRR